MSFGSVVQEGINLAKIQGNHFDYRLYAAHGEIPLSELRISPNMITNVSLGAKEVRNEDVKNYLSQELIFQSHNLSKEISKHFQSKDLALDLCFDAKTNEIYCLEVNFLPGLTLPEERYIYDFDINKNVEYL